jgi:hypothetical protein
MNNLPNLIGFFKHTTLRYSSMPNQRGGGPGSGGRGMESLCPRQQVGRFCGMLSPVTTFNCAESQSQWPHLIVRSTPYTGYTSLGAHDNWL